MPQWSVGRWLVTVGGILAAATVWVALAKDALAAGILQAVTLVFSTYGAWLLSHNAATRAGREGLHKQARPAFRRVLNLYQGLGRQKDAVRSEMARLEELATLDGSGHYRAAAERPFWTPAWGKVN